MRLIEGLGTSGTIEIKRKMDSLYPGGPQASSEDIIT